MNRLSKYFTILLSAGILTACQKDYSPIGTPDGLENLINDAQGKIECNVNGGKLTTEFQSAYSLPVDGTSFKSLVITGVKYGDERIKENSTTINLIVNVYEGPKWYTVNYPAMATLTYTHIEDGTVSYTTSTSDEEQYVEITEDNGKFIKGKFRIKVTAPGAPAGEFLDITDGEFNVPIMNR